MSECSPDGRSELNAGPAPWDVVVLGSANVDLVIDIAELPAPGQTLLARSASRGPGGKGANQAVAAARSGASTTFAAAFGDDADGASLRTVLQQAGVDLSHSQVGSAATGMAVVLLQDGGENSIVVVSGANATLEPPALVRAAAVLLTQLEIPLQTVIDAARTARAAGTMVMLNAAPFQPLPVGLIDVVDLLVVNEQEARDLAHQLALTDDVDASDRPGLLADLLQHFAQVIITYGADGSSYGSQTGARHVEPAPAVTAIDTTGAGDTYCGVLAAALAHDRRAVAEGMRRAAAAAALCVQRRGAIAAIPTGADIERALSDESTKEIT